MGQNTWIGIYPKNDDNYYMWVYTGCNNVLGDQEDSDDKSNDCIKKKRKKEKSHSVRTIREEPISNGLLPLVSIIFNSTITTIPHMICIYQEMKPLPYLIEH